MVVSKGKPRSNFNNKQGNLASKPSFKNKSPQNFKGKNSPQKPFGQGGGKQLGDNKKPFSPGNKKPFSPGNKKPFQNNNQKNFSNGNSFNKGKGQQQQKFTKKEESESEEFSDAGIEGSDSASEMEVASPVQKKAAVTKVPQVAKANPPKKIEEPKAKNVPAAPKATVVKAESNPPKKTEGPKTKNIPAAPKATVVKTEEKKTESSEKLSKNQKKKLQKQNKAKAAATESTVEQSKATTKKDKTPKVPVVVPVEKCNLTSEKKSEIIVKHNARQIDLNSKTIFIRPIPAKSTLESIKELVPDMVTCRIPLKNHNQAKGFAFIQLNDANQANSYVTKLNGKKFNEKALIAKLATSREVKNEDELKFNRLFVNCLAVDVKSNDLKLLFPSAKTISVHDKANCLGSADVTFNNSEDAVRAFELQHNKVIKNHPIHIAFFVKPAESNKNQVVKVVNATTKAPAAVNNKKRKHNDDDEDEEETSVVKAKEQAKPGKKIKVDNDLEKILSQIKKATKEESDEESDDDDDSEEAYEIDDSEEDDSEVDDDE